MKELELDAVCESLVYRPEYANETDACMDLKAKVDGDEAVLLPGTSQVFGTGLKVKIPEGYVMLIHPRSSTGIKLRCRLTNSTGVIDAGYRDEIKMAVHNFGCETITIKDGQRLAQFYVIPRPKLKLNFVADDIEFREGDRGGGIGSTGA